LRTQLTNLALENDRLRKELQAKDQATAWLDRENQALKTDAKVKDNHIQELANAL
jgi:FtsZ-binding cell division protein ZapB